MNTHILPLRELEIWVIPLLCSCFSLLSFVVIKFYFILVLYFCFKSTTWSVQVRVNYQTTSWSNVFTCCQLEKKFLWHLNSNFVCEWLWKKFWYDYSFGLLTKVFASIPSDLTELRRIFVQDSPNRVQVIHACNRHSVEIAGWIFSLLFSLVKLYNINSKICRDRAVASVRQGGQIAP